MPKPWTYETVPMHRPLWVRMKQLAGFCCTPISINPMGLVFLLSDKGRVQGVQCITWADLLVRYEWRDEDGQWKPCGRR
jgi:hypothetical protein